ncbi:undecaprenyl-diphosphate phosphatase [Paludibacterium paludis]|uniref:Undecaprenyl-diphosphatase n=1 Tax=Paludibacterium paludis TaxID=1225769 RepID=A0A918U9I5_9NEIS|nr:undecaprenyl-diphosphate phosphatase [Paludibacterium paludis]GGY12142.1 undecaprenyl-diphosphatase 1 [Paludibacterium paludis]
MPTMQAVLFAIMQGITELFPISSLGHGVILPELLGWQLHPASEAFLPFMVVLHLGTALALFHFFRKDWFRLIGGFVRARGGDSDPEARLMWRLFIGTVPAGLLGLLLEKKLKVLFGSVDIILVVLMINGVILIAGDGLRRRTGGKPLEELTPLNALRIGFAQALALIPGISRSGVTLIAGISTGLDYASAARFSFLLATPIIAAAGILEVPKMLKMGAHLDLALVGACGVLSGAFAWLSTWALMRWFNKHEIQALRPFGVYCILLGLAGLALRQL